MSASVRILESIGRWLRDGPLGDKLRPADYRALISCGFAPALQNGGDIGTIHTSCAIFARAILHDADVMPATKPGRIGWPMWGGVNRNGWLGDLGPHHRAAHKWTPSLQVAPAWLCYIESATNANNSHVFFLVEHMAPGTLLPDGKRAQHDTWRVAQGGGGDGTRCAYGYRTLSDPTGRPLRYVFDPNAIMAERDTDPAPPPTTPRPEMPTPIETPHPFLRTLRVGSIGEDVRSVQLRLGIDPDGSYGPVTRRAVQEFQAAHGLDDDGAVGPLTRKAMGL